MIALLEMITHSYHLWTTLPTIPSNNNHRYWSTGSPEYIKHVVYCSVCRDQIMSWGWVSFSDHHLDSGTKQDTQWARVVGLHRLRYATANWCYGAIHIFLQNASLVAIWVPFSLLNIQSSLPHFKLKSQALSLASLLSPIPERDTHSQSCPTLYLD